jgi:phospholipase/carboxylesterase
MMNAINSSSPDQMPLANGGIALNYLVHEPIELPAIKRAIILLHGVGSNEKDLFALTGQLPADFYIFSVRGQFTLGPDRYAWYQVDFSTGKPVFNTQQELSSREQIEQFVKQIKHKYQLDEVYLAGFSQGAIMRYTIGLTQPREITGVISLGGRVLEEIQNTIEPIGAFKQLRVFIAHGVQDGTLPIHYARTAKTFMETLGVQLSYHEYQMGHQINLEVLADLSNWLRS